jgi:hypothetical protein
MLLAILGVAAASLASPAQAQRSARAARSEPVSAAPLVGDEVVVRGRRMSEIEDGLRVEIGKFIEEVAAAPMGAGLARWDKSVCIGVHNLERTAAQYVVDRVSRLALEVGLTPGEPGCIPDVIIVFTTDGKFLANYLVKERERVLRPTNFGRVHRGIAGMVEFAETDRAVRWWHISMPVSARTGQPALTGTVSVSGPSRIHDGVVDALWRVIVIVDSTKLTGTTWQQLGDYLAIVSLAQIDLGTDPQAFDSILNLFTNPGAYSGLTDWDRAYVRSLYQFDQERIPELQRGVLTNEMLRLALGPELEDARPGRGRARR